MAAFAYSAVVPPLVGAYSGPPAASLGAATKFVPSVQNNEVIPVEWLSKKFPISEYLNRDTDKARSTTFVVSHTTGVWSTGKKKYVKLKCENFPQFVQASHRILKEMIACPPLHRDYWMYVQRISILLILSCYGLSVI